MTVHRSRSAGWPPEGLEAVAECPGCNSRKRRILYENLTDNVFNCAPGLWTLYECTCCGNAYLDPRPTRETIHRAYEDYYTHKAPEGYGLAEKGVLGRSKTALANGYRNWRYGTTRLPATKLGVPVIQMLPGLQNALDREFRNLPKGMGGKRLLDVGFGSGAFLKKAVELGCEAMGVDLDQEVVTRAVAHGLNVRCGGIEEWEDQPESFDVVTLSHVIEHVHDPRAVLRSAYALLKPGGFIWLETPNIHSIGHQRFRVHWRGLEPPRHLILFNWQTISELLEEAGFSKLTPAPNIYNYRTLAAKSLAISYGQDPYAPVNLPVSERAYQWIARVRLLKDYRLSEFVTVMASKGG